jgi:hypothetical protein
MSRKSSFIDKSQPKNIRIGIWSSIISAIMLIGIGIFWLAHPSATEGSFSIVPDSPAAVSLAKIVAIFKAIGDFLPPIFVLLAIYFKQYKLAGYFHIVTLILVIVVDMLYGLHLYPMQVQKIYFSIFRLQYLSLLQLIIS